MFVYNKIILFSTIQRDKEKDPIGIKNIVSSTSSILNKPKSTIDDVRKK